ncbi:MAG: hypothetical protein U0232_07040 [Thermomicrobiales bacterium]
MLPQTAHVEVDALREFVAFLPWTTRSHQPEQTPPPSRATSPGAASTSSSPTRSARQTTPTQAQLADLNTPIHTITLSSTLATALTDRGTCLTDHERRRIREQYADNRHNPPFGITRQQRPNPHRNRHHHPPHPQPPPRP